MAKYIKWELKDYFNKKFLFFIGVGIIFLLTIILPFESDLFISGLVHSAFFIIVYISLIFAFIIGTKRITDSFSKKTFLLESMIPLPSKKILLSKFLIGFLINLIHCIIGIIGLIIIIAKGGKINVFDMFDAIFKNIDLLSFIRFCLTYIISILAFMSTVVLGYIIGKIIKPNGKTHKIIAVITWFLIFYTVSYIAGIISVESEYVDIILDIVYAITIASTFYISSWLIENKLEIYN